MKALEISFCRIILWCFRNAAGAGLTLTSVDSGWFMTLSTSIPSKEMLFSIGRIDSGVP